MRRPVDHARGLLEKARRDLVAAEAIRATGEAFDMACFHAQQAVEKALKALLALDDVAYPLRHDLGELVALAAPRWPLVREAADAIFALGPFAVAVRYDATANPSAVNIAEAGRSTGLSESGWTRPSVFWAASSEDDCEAPPPLPGSRGVWVGVAIR